MAKVPGKGSIVKHTISASLTAIAQLTSAEVTGTQSLTWDSTTLDGGVFKTYDQTGYAEPGTVSLEMLFDPALAGHQFITDTIRVPADNAMTLTYADAATTTQAFVGAGITFGAVIAMDDGVKATAEYQIDGDPGWPT